MDTQSIPSDNGGGPPTLAVAGVTKARCPKCQAEYSWTDPDFAVATCVRCEQALVIVATTGNTIEEAITAAAQVLPEKVEPRQPSLPGIQPMFDLAGALDSIEQAEGEASEAEARYNDAAAKAKYLRKRADDSNQKLREMIQQFSQRRHDSRYEPKEPDEQTQPDRETGSAVGGQVDQPGTADIPGDGSDATVLLQMPADGTGDDVARLSGEEEAQSDEVVHNESRSADGDAQASARSVAAPDNPGRNSEAGNGAQALHDGGDGAAVLSSARQSGSEPDDSHLVIDCSNAGTLALLHQAGADQITLDAVGAWSEAQYTEARAWALEQIEATAHDEPGHHTSVYWPEHVSLAHHGPDLATHTPKKRTAKAKKTGRRRAR